MNDQASLNSATGGFTLVELMVAVALGSLIMLGAISVFVSSRESHQANSAIARLQDNARFAMDQIVADLRMAGFFGCSDDQATISNSIGSSGILWDTANPLEGFDDADGSDTWSMSGRAVTGTPVIGTDGITIRYLTGFETVGTGIGNEVTATTIDSVTIAPALAATISSEGAIIAGVTDCGGTDIFEIESINGTTGVITADAAFSRAFDAGASTFASTLVARRYYVANNADAVPSLWVMDFSGGGTSISSPVTEPAALELVTGVQDMQILYGLDTDNDLAPNLYATAGESGVLDTADDWGRVVTVRFSLLMRTENPLGSEDTAGRSYRVLTKTYTTPTGSSDANKTERGHRRRVFTATANVRNIQ